MVIYVVRYGNILLFFETSVHFDNSEISPIDIQFYMLAVV